MDSKAVFEKVGECVFAKDWDTLATLATEDCTVTGLDGKPNPWLENWKGLYEMAGKVRWINTYSLVTESVLIYRCYDYFESKDGSKDVMLYIDGVVTLKDGKISKIEWSGHARRSLG